MSERYDEEYRQACVALGKTLHAQCAAHRCAYAWPAECSSGNDGWGKQRRCFKLIEEYRAARSGVLTHKK